MYDGFCVVGDGIDVDVFDGEDGFGVGYCVFFIVVLLCVGLVGCVVCCLVGLCLV